MKKIGMIVLKASKRVGLAFAGAMFFCLTMVATVFAVRYFWGDPLMFSGFEVGGIFGATMTMFALELKG